MVGEQPLPAGFHEEPLTHVQAYTVGYDREISGGMGCRRQWSAGDGVRGGEAVAGDLWIGSGGGVGVCEVAAGGGEVKWIRWD